MSANEPPRNSMRIGDGIYQLATGRVVLWNAQCGWVAARNPERTIARARVSKAARGLNNATRGNGIALSPDRRTLEALAEYAAAVEVAS